MNSENLLSYIENKEPLDEKAISQIMLLLEKYPYFQLAHMLLLKAMQTTHSEKYNKQLRISGSFISDKRKLFQFINSAVPPTIKKSEEKDKSLKVETSVGEKKETPIEKKAEVKTPVIKTEVRPAEKKTVVIPEKKIEIKKEVTVVKTESEKKEQPVKKKVDLSEEEIEKIADENSKIKHKEIIKDFFHKQGGPSIVEKTVVEPKKNENIQKESTLAEQKREIAEKKVVKEISFTNKEDEKKQVTDSKISAQDVIKKEQAESPSKVKIVEREKIEEKKKEEIVEKKNEIEKKPVVETKLEIPETKKEPVVNKTIETNKEDASNDTMSNIFSKIRQIKKEMNITSESTPETIDINKDEDPKKLVRSKKPEDKKGTGRVIKESFIGFTDETNDVTNEVEDKTEIKETNAEKEEIKESLTAKDLFRQHLKMKERSLYDDSELKKDKTESSSTKSPISKLVEIVNEETAVKDESVKIEKKEILSETKIKSEESTPETKTEFKKIEGETAADALLRRIAEKKKRIKEEQALEEKKKEEERKKELDAVNELVKKSNQAISTEKEKKEENTLIEQINKTDLSDEITKKEASPEKENKSFKLIDSFIQKAESLERIGSKESSLVGDISESSTKESEEIMTETYADLLIQQKNYQKAIEVYNKLILKIPEKKTYFAIQIKKVESLIK